VATAAAAAAAEQWYAFSKRHGARCTAAHVAAAAAGAITSSHGMWQSRRAAASAVIQPAVVGGVRQRPCSSDVGSCAKLDCNTAVQSPPAVACSNTKEQQQIVAALVDLQKHSSLCLQMRLQPSSLIMCYVVVCTCFLSTAAVTSTCCCPMCGCGPWWTSKPSLTVAVG
jgi:hypothetical protein